MTEAIAGVGSDTEAKLRWDRPVTLLGAGPAPEADIRLALGLAPVLVAADGGAGWAVELGLIPEAVVGDLDSLDPLTRGRLGEERLHRVAEQETTDFQKCLRLVDAPFTLGVGFVGARLDHELAALAALVRHPGRRCILIGPEDVVFAAPPSLEIGLEPGTRLSLFPFAEVTGRSEGLRWPIDGIAFAPDGRSGTSNRVTGPVRLRFSGRGMLVLLPRACLPAALEALTA